MTVTKGNNIKMITVKQVGSLIGQTKSVRSTIKGLGLGKINSVSALKDNPTTLGMVNKVSHLVKVINN